MHKMLLKIMVFLLALLTNIEITEIYTSFLKSFSLVKFTLRYNSHFSYSFSM